MAKRRDEEVTHVQMPVRVKEKLEKLRDELELRSIAVVIDRLLDGKIKAT